MIKVFKEVKTNVRGKISNKILLNEIKEVREYLEETLTAAIKEHQEFMSRNKERNVEVNRNILTYICEELNNTTQKHIFHEERLINEFLSLY